MATPIAADSTFIDGNGKPANDLESAKFTKDKETVDVVQPTAKLIGLTKEQLEQYRNDPFWKTVRYGLFITFWLIWLAMFVGAILIVVMSPKCVDVKWQDKMVSYKIFTLAFNDADPSKDMNSKVGDFAGIKAKLGELKEMGISAIWPTPILETNKNNPFSPEAIVKLKVNEQLGGEDQLKDLVKSAHAKDMKVIVDLPLTVSVEENWFKGKGIAIDEAIKPGSGNVAALNLKNQKVEDSLVGLARKYIEWGIDGINLANYGMGNEDLTALIQKIREIAGAEHMPIYSEMPANGNNIYQSESLIGQEQMGKKELIGKLNANLDEIIKKNATSTTIWQLGSVNAKGHRVDELLKDAGLTPIQKGKIAFLFTLAQLFMPSPINVLYGEELALSSGKALPEINNATNLVIYPWNNSIQYTTRDGKYFLPSENAATNNFEDQKKRENSPLKMFTKLAKLHQQNDFILGTFKRISIGKLDAYLMKPATESTSNSYGLIINWNGEDTLDGQSLNSQIGSKKLKVLAFTDGGNFGDLIDFGAKEGVKVMIPAFGAVAFQTE